MKNIVIIGNGIAGITAARHIRKLSQHRITVISSETRYFFSRTALMYVYMGHMKFEHTQPYENWFWEKNNIDLVEDHVVKVNGQNKTIQLRSGQHHSFDILIIASGSVSNKFGWPGQDLRGVQGLYSKQDLDLLEQYAPNNKECRQAVIVGGGLIGIELAEMLQSRNIPVTFLVREKSFWSNVLPEGESAMITRHIKEHGIDLRLNTNLKEILSNNQGRVRGVVTEDNVEIPCDLCGLTPGVSPNISYLEGSDIETDRGILVDEYLQTNIENVYAIGDCAQLRTPTQGRKAIEAVWYAGRMMGETLAWHLCEKPRKYRPGPWFNSAKFMDIEYQTYGNVSNTPSERERHLYWENRNDNKAINIAYDPVTGKFLGINTLGIRLKHEYFDQCLRSEIPVETVIEHLEKANFDPEFYRNYFQDIKESINQQISIA
ncbi:NAD(P)/FAD-dependent oxidoreductase [Robertkochia marina]|uniref:NAD(P)/FAD-dependent oxidoreductase n=1 Tax=Robertkochia marina TaxID=1227945 RepID=A0A4S3M6D2_9FLAO|nr:FAD-dependent oxidoreductase [Robertkochia marina]THD69787.1 NAD(P)/FAD-dependent oxidoreductase [Robertkochia marina]TRZ46869.1 NAD(P)/FAD-dependent oxidoreductase [Robertkochia marina]